MVIAVAAVGAVMDIAADAVAGATVPAAVAEVAAMDIAVAADAVTVAVHAMVVAGTPTGMVGAMAGRASATESVTNAMAAEPPIATGFATGAMPAGRAITVIAMVAAADTAMVTGMAAGPRAVRIGAPIAAAM